MVETEIGKVSDYFAKVKVAAVKMTGSLKKGQTIHIKGHTTDLTQTADSMQIDRKDVEEANTGDEIGIMVQDRVRRHDKVFLVEE